MVIDQSLCNRTQVHKGKAAVLNSNSVATATCILKIAMVHYKAELQLMRTSVILQLLLVHVNDICTYAIHEILRVGDHEQYSLEALQGLLKPHTGF